jgi:TolA-binding protein
MTRPDEHPEEWLDSAAAGALSPAERHELELHLAECPACSAQMAAPRRSRELAPRDVDGRLDRLAVERALARTANRRSRPRRRSPRIWIRLGATALVLASAASATDWVARRWNVHPFARRAALPDSGIQAAREVAPRQEEPRAEPIAPVSVQPASESALPSKPPVSIRRPALEKATAAELLEQARELRRKGALDAASGVYRSLQRAFPASTEARLSYAILGRLLLERGHADQALAQFDRYLATQGPVAEDALAGRAAALQHLHRQADEASAWQALLSQFPQSVYTSRARSRLRELGVNVERRAP